MRYFNPKKITLSPIRRSRSSSATDIYEYSYTYFDLEFLFNIRQTFDLTQHQLHIGSTLLENTSLVAFNNGIRFRYQVFGH